MTSNKYYFISFNRSKPKICEKINLYGVTVYVMNITDMSTIHRLKDHNAEIYVSEYESISFANDGLFNQFIYNFPKLWTKFFISNLDEIKEISKCLSMTRKTLPDVRDVLKIFNLIGPRQIKIVILGQEPYSTPGCPDGIAFSSRQSRIPPSLENMFKELKLEGFNPDNNPNLERWVRQGVFLLNVALTTEEGTNNNVHSKLWKDFITRLLHFLYVENPNIIGVLMGTKAHSYYRYFNHINKIVHPSPQSASGGFFGCNIFMNVNFQLEELGIEPIDWK